MKAIYGALHRYYKSTDKLLWFVCAFASAFGVLLLCGIVNSGYANDRRVIVQIIATFIGFAVAVVISKIDYVTMADMWKLHSTAAYALVLLTFLVGVARDDDKAWLPLPFGLTFQPSEVLKISFIITFALHLQKVKGGLNDPKTLMGALVHAAVPILLVFLQGDAGSALVFVMIAVCMLFAAGIDKKYILSAVGSLVVLAPVAWLLMDNHKRLRVMTVFNPDLDPTGVGMQQRYGRIALGSGKLWGKGVFAGSHQYVPEIYNDFIFTFVGEALGFMGCLAVISILAFICVRILVIGSRSKDALGNYICVGIFAMIAFQTIANIGMCLSILPVIGLTLPLFSSGGTSAIMTYAGIGLALSVYMHNNKNLFLDS